MKLFGCNHPFKRLAVEMEATEKPIDDDFTEITYYIVCRKCSEVLLLKHAKLIGGVDAFMERGRLEYSKALRAGLPLSTTRDILRRSIE